MTLRNYRGPPKDSRESLKDVSTSTTTVDICYSKIKKEGLYLYKIKEMKK